MAIVKKPLIVYPVWIRQDGVWVESVLYLRRGGVWVNPEIWVRDNGKWKRSDAHIPI